MKIAYLDHNHWIELARAYHGKVDDPVLVRVLRILQTAIASDQLALPLSAVHYMEAARKANTGARTRLGVVMWELSRGLTLASYRAILTHELEMALAKRLPQVRPAPFTLLSRGAAHAFGMDPRPYRVTTEVGAGLPQETIDRLEEIGTAIIERALVVGHAPSGERVPVFGITEHNKRFQEYLRALPGRLAQLPLDKWTDALYAISIVDILDVLNDVMARHDLYADQVAVSGDDFRALVDDLPSRRVDLQLHQQVVRNPNLQPKLNDLEDWAGLAPAAAHCDVLVCEKHFANLLLRGGFVPRATVLTDVRALPAALGLDTAA